MKTTHDSWRASDVKFAWRCGVVWWLDALALLLIMVGVTICQAFRDQRLKRDPADAAENDSGYDLEEFSSAAWAGR